MRWPRLRPCRGWVGCPGVKPPQASMRLPSWVPARPMACASTRLWRVCSWRQRWAEGSLLGSSGGQTVARACRSAALCTYCLGLGTATPARKGCGSRVTSEQWASAFWKGSSPCVPLGALLTACLLLWSWEALAGGSGCWRLLSYLHESQMCDFGSLGRVSWDVCLDLVPVG